VVTLKDVPASLLVGTSYTLEVSADLPIVQANWVVTEGSTEVARGKGKSIYFVPKTASPHVVDVVVLKNTGAVEEQLFTFAVFSENVPTTVGVSWDYVSYKRGDTLKGKVLVRNTSSRVAPVKWVLQRNNYVVAEGTSVDVVYPDVDFGVYTLTATVTDPVHGVFTATSHAFVHGGFEAHSSIIPAPPEGTLQYLGAVYSEEMVGSGTAHTSLPDAIYSLTQTLHLLPGTTHVKFELDPEQGTVDDEVVVRTAQGNLTLVGPPNGLNDQNVGYDYSHGKPYVTAPPSLQMPVTIEIYNTQGATSGNYNVRVRVRCYRMGRPLFEYENCPYSIHPGGAGERSRRFALVFSNVEAETDIAGTSRFGAGVVQLSTPNVTTIQAPLSVTGAPHVTDRRTGVFFTPANRLAVYEPPTGDLPELDAQAVCAVDGHRPFYFTLNYPTIPPVVQRIKRVYGKVSLYMSTGGVEAGSTVNVDIVTSKLYLQGDGSLLGRYNVPLLITEDAYSDNPDQFIKVAEAEIDLSDPLFSEQGVVAFVSTQESVPILQPVAVDRTTFWNTPLEFAVIGDFGIGTADELAVANMVKAWKPEFIITTGDNWYGQTHTFADIDLKIGQYYHEYLVNYTGIYGAGSPTKRFIATIGNHERDPDERLPIHNAYLSLPADYYRWGWKDLIEVFVVDSGYNNSNTLAGMRQADGNTVGSVQALWLQNALASSTARWKIVTFHHPAYSSYVSASPTDQMDPDGFLSYPALRWPFAAWGADLVLNGHVHSYERFEIDGIPYIVNGIGGAERRQFSGAVEDGSVIQYDNNFGAQRCSATRNTLTLKLITVSGSLRDTITLTK
jgi:hypothetical protein